MKGLRPGALGAVSCCIMVVFARGVQVYMVDQCVDRTSQTRPSSLPGVVVSCCITHSVRSSP